MTRTSVHKHLHLVGVALTYPWGTLGQWDIFLILPPLVSRILFRCLIFNCYNISIYKKKEKLKDETSAFVKKERSMMRHLKTICEINGDQIKEHDIPLT